MTNPFGTPGKTKAQLATSHTPVARKSDRHTKATGRTHVHFPPIHHTTASSGAPAQAGRLPAAPLGTLPVATRSSHSSTAHLVHKDIHVAVSREPRVTRSG